LVLGRLRLIAPALDGVGVAENREAGSDDRCPAVEDRLDVLPDVGRVARRALRNA